MPTTLATPPAEPRLPRYLQALDALRRDVLAGVYPKRLPTELELAKRYGVSRMTLRRALGVMVDEGVLEGRRGLGTFLKEQEAPSYTVVLAMAEDLVVNPDDPYHQQMVISAIHASSRRGWTLRVVPSIAKLKAHLTAGRNLSTAGCIALAFDADDAQQLAELALPVVTVDGEPLANRAAVMPENIKSTAQVVQRLIALGHREIVHCSGKLNSASGRERLQSWLGTMAAQGVPLRDGAVHQGRFLISDGYAAMAQWWTAPVRPTAVVCANDMMAMGAMYWLQEHGVAIGSQVSIVGCDGSSVSRLAFPGLATLVLDFNAHLDSALQALLDGSPPGIRRSPMTLREGTSLRPAPVP